MDVNGSIVDAVNERRCDSSEPGLAEGLAKTVDLTATTNMAAAVADARLIFILVPTPNSGGRDYYNHRLLAFLPICPQADRSETESIRVKGD